MPYTENTLEELALMYGTDKKDHGYIPFYEQHLPKNPKKILEIGIKDGRSARMWLKYFPDCLFHGLDLFKEYPPPFQDPRATWHSGHQCDWELLEQLRKEDFDVIIDDGSHNSRDQMITFFGLFNGKHYFIEDVKCCLEQFYSQGLPFRFRAYQLFNQLMHPKGFLPELIHNESIILICS